jgi:ABC-type uncharacterized transport system permease subunit
MSAITAPPRQESRVRSMLDFYGTTTRTAIQTSFQYRAATYMYMVGMVAEPVIYLVVWSTIAEWTFYFPIEALVGSLSTAALLRGLGMHALWTAIGAGLVWVCFRASVKHYTAVGN